MRSFKLTNAGWEVFNLYTPVLASLVVVVLCGCSGVPIHSKNGTTHYVILGVGVVSMKEQKGVSIADGVGLGLMGGPGGFTIGFGQQHDLQIDPTTASNVVISIRTTPFSLTVTNFEPYWLPESMVNPQKGNQVHE